MRPELCLTGTVYILTKRSHATAPKQQDFYTGRGAGIDGYPVIIVRHYCGLGAVQLELVFHFDSLKLVVFVYHGASSKLLGLKGTGLLGIGLGSSVGKGQMVMCFPLL